MSVDADAMIADQKLPVMGPAPHRAAATASPARPSGDLLGRLPGLLAVLDWLGVAGAGFLANGLMEARGGEATIHPLAMLLAATLTVNLLRVGHAYDVRSVAHAAAQFVKVSVAWIGTVLALAGVNYLLGQSHDSLNDPAQLWYGAVWLYLVATRYAIRWQLLRWRRQGRLARRVAILGSGLPAVRLADRVRRAKDADFVGLFLDGAIPDGIDEVAGDTDGLVALAVSGRVDEVIFSSSWHSSQSLNNAIARLSVLQTELKIDPGLSSLNVMPQALGFVAGIPTLTLQHRPLSGWGAPVKRAEDILFSGLLLICAAPLLLAIAILIKIETRGPVIFRQERYGFNNNRIVIFKFRSMYHQAEPEAGVPQARRNDSRVTRVGAILRRTSLDELPQLMNVLLGDMSLVGPRPHATPHNEKYAKLIDRYLARHRMKPGLTGWAQVNGARGETESPQQMQRRLEYDLAYIAHWSLLLDLKVILTTIPVVLRGKNAY